MLDPDACTQDAGTYEACIYEICMCDASQKWDRRTDERTYEQTAEFQDQDEQKNTNMNQANILLQAGQQILQGTGQQICI